MHIETQTRRDGARDSLLKKQLQQFAESAASLAIEMKVRVGFSPKIIFVIDTKGNQD